LTPKFAEINPFKKVPAIDHDGFKLSERQVIFMLRTSFLIVVICFISLYPKNLQTIDYSVSILRYLCRAFPVPETWYPRDLKLQARVDEYMAWQHLNIRAFGSLVFRTKLIEPNLTGQPVNEKQLASYAHKLGGVLDQIEHVWLKDKNFMAGQELTIADLLATTEIEQPGT